MNYFIAREGKEYGPYTLADLQRYVASGNILVTELTRNQETGEWIPVSQVIGNIPVPASAPIAPVRPQVPVPMRDGNQLIVPRGASLPHFCVKCAQPPDGSEQQKNFSWCHPALALLILLGLIGIIVYAVVYGITKKQMMLNLPLCAEHQSAKKKKTWLGALLLLVSPLFVILAVTSDKLWFILPFLALLLAGGIVLTRVSPLRPKKIDEFQGIFLGAEEPFLNLVDSQSAQAASAGYGS